MQTFHSIFLTFFLLPQSLAAIWGGQKTLKCPFWALYGLGLHVEILADQPLIESVFSKTTWQISFVALQPRNVVAIFIRICLFIRINAEGLTS